jgi:sensor histidine kinase YesM
MKYTRSIVSKNIVSQLLLLLITCTLIYTILPSLIYYTSKDSIVKSELDLNERLMSEMDDYFKGINKFTSFICNDPTITDLVNSIQSNNSSTNKNVKLLENHLANASNYYYMDSYQVIHLYLALDNGETVTSVGMPNNMKQYVSNLFQFKYNRKTNNCFLSAPFSSNDPQQTGVFVDRSNKVFCYFSPYVNPYGYTGELVVVSSYDTITNIFKSYSKDNIDFMLLDQDGSPMFPGQNFANSNINLDMVKESANQEFYNYETYKYINGGLFSVRNSLYSKWKLVRYDSEAELMKSSVDICNKIIALLVVCTFLYCIFSILLSQKSLLAIKSLSKQMKEISKGNYGARLSVHTNDEIEVLGETFNNMADKLEKNIQKLMEKERREQDLRYSLLVSQIDPHFIYNAMNTITYLASCNQPDAVIEVNRSIIGILKDRLRVGCFKVSDSLRQEIDTIKNYLIIQEYRYSNLFDVRWDLDESLLNIEIPKNILQPLVENALYHGVLANKDENGDIIGGYITISIKEVDRLLILSVKDNGIGMPQSTIDKILLSENGALDNNQKGEHIGLCNIFARLRYIYKNDFTFKIESQAGLGTNITIKIKLDKANHNQ